MRAGCCCFLAGQGATVSIIISSRIARIRNRVVAAIGSRAFNLSGVLIAACPNFIR